MRLHLNRLAWHLMALLIALPSLARAEEPARKGSLVIVGGGGMPDEVREKFMALAGGLNAKLVVIPTASESADRQEEADAWLEPWRKSRPAGLKLLHTRSRQMADDPEFVRPIAEASAVWFSGGDQSKLIAAYRGTAVEREFRALLQRGGVIGGTSAGAAVMSDVMIEGGNPQARVGRGFGFLKDAVVDQHFLARNRVNRLIGVLTDHPDKVGIGIDEGTAFVLEGEKWSVIGRSYVMAIRLGQDGGSTRLESYGQGLRGAYPDGGFPAVER